MNDIRESTPSAEEALRTRILGAAAALLFLGLVVLMYTGTAPEPAPKVVYPELPDFAAISDVREKKQAFFGYLEPMIEAHNERVRMTRRQLEDWRARRAEGDRLRRARARSLCSASVIGSRFLSRVRSRWSDWMPCLRVWTSFHHRSSLPRPRRSRPGVRRALRARRTISSVSGASPRGAASCRIVDRRARPTRSSASRRSMHRSTAISTT